MTLRAEERRIRRAIGALLATLAPLAVAQAACGKSDDGTGADSGTTDATLDHAETTDDGAPSGEDSSFDGGPDVTFDANCTSTITVLDAGMDGDAYADPGCSYALSCGIMGVLRTSGCQVLSVTEIDAAPTPLGCWVVADTCAADVFVPDANLTVQCLDCIAGGGRRPAGLRATRTPARRAARSRVKSGKEQTGIGDYFGAMAFEEAAAVLAFQRMSEELRMHGAPASLARAAERATKEERRHAKTFRTLALRAGAEPRGARLAGGPRHRLSSIAVENAAEGCVRETFGALLLFVQARRATDPRLQKAFERIARDEARHAALSWALSRWAEPKLTPTARAKVDAARRNAVAALREQIAKRHAQPYDAQVGHPSRAEAQRLLSDLATSLDLTA
jgi:rubrerythrin